MFKSVYDKESAGSKTLLSKYPTLSSEWLEDGLCAIDDGAAGIQVGFHFVSQIENVFARKNHHN